MIALWRAVRQAPTMPDQPMNRHGPRNGGPEPKAKSGAASGAKGKLGPPPWWNTHLTVEEEAKLGRESTRQEGRSSREDMKAFTPSPPGYVPKPDT